MTNLLDLETLLLHLVKTKQLNPLSSTMLLHANYKSSKDS